MFNSPLHFNTMVYQIFSLICSEVYQDISHKMIFVIHDALWPHRSSVFLSVKLETFLTKCIDQSSYPQHIQENNIDRGYFEILLNEDIIRL